MARRRTKNSSKSRGLGASAETHDQRAKYGYEGAVSTISNMPVNCYGAINKIATAAAEISAARAHTWAAVEAEGSNAARRTLLGKINTLQKKLDGIIAQGADRCKGSIR